MPETSFRLSSFADRLLTNPPMSRITDRVTAVYGPQSREYGTTAWEVERICNASGAHLHHSRTQVECPLSTRQAIHQTDHYGGTSLPMASYDYIFLSASPEHEQTANSDIYSAPSADTKAAYIAPLFPFHSLEENSSNAEMPSCPSQQAYRGGPPYPALAEIPGRKDLWLPTVGDFRQASYPNDDVTATIPAFPPTLTRKMPRSLPSRRDAEFQRLRQQSKSIPDNSSPDASRASPPRNTTTLQAPNRIAPHSSPGRPISGWLPVAARDIVLRLYIGWNTFLVAVLVVLWSLSHLRGGLARVDLDHTIALHAWNLVPTAIASVTASCLGAIWVAFSSLRPYTLPQRPKGVNAREALMTDYSRLAPMVAISALHQRDWVILFLIVAVMLCVLLGPLSATLFQPRNVWIQQTAYFNYTRILGLSNEVDVTSAFIRALLLSAARGIYGITEVRLPSLANQVWTVGPIGPVIHNLQPLALNAASPSNLTIPGWYGIRSDPACNYGRIVNATVTDFNLKVTFVDQAGQCMFQKDFPSFFPFGYVNAALVCPEANDSPAGPPPSIAQGGTQVYARLTPTRLSSGDLAAAVVIYCRPRVAIMSADVTLDARTHALLAVDNVTPLSATQQQLYDPTNLSASAAAGRAWNGFSIDLAINKDIPVPLLDQLNNWVNLTISVYVGETWLNGSTVLSRGTVTEIAQAYSDELRAFYLDTLTNFYQTYLTLLAAGCYCIDGPPRLGPPASLSSLQTRIFVSTWVCCCLIVALSLSTTLVLIVHIYHRPHAPTHVAAPPTMLITPMLLQTDRAFQDAVRGWRTLPRDELARVLAGLHLGIMWDGALRALPASVSLRRRAGYVIGHATQTGRMGVDDDAMEAKG